ncbi:MAG: LLM class flavin-dependent oxidoreductase [Acidobacteria bacterium]|nr:LLM class flavin-dependent oxidoreductase [Acidobacteriota bacterium]
MSTQHCLGLVIGSAIAPGQVPGATATAEASGFDEVWLAEDFFSTGGISGVALALDSTSRVKVGLGVVSAMARHPALLAMEISTISRVHPNRLIAGIGLGVPAWVRQMGLYPPSTLAALRECVTSVKSLLRGETVHQDGQVYTFENVTLTYPEVGKPTPIRMGVSGPRMLRLSGEVADGSVLSVAASHEYVQWARNRINEGRKRGGRTDDHPITVFAIYSVDADGAAARESAKTTLAFYGQHGANALTDVYGISDELNALIATGGYDALLAGMPDQWVDDLTIAGTPEECAARIKGFYDAGADSVALYPVATDRVDDIVRLTADAVMPWL